jgi:beta-N-acetylhexosaminidase
MSRFWHAVLWLGLLFSLSPLQASPALVDTLTLEQQVGQLFMVTIHGAQLPEAGRDFLQRHQPGAVVLFTSNFGPPEALTRLTNSYQAAITAVGAPPLLIAVDQEGGIVQRLTDGFSTLPLPRLLTATNNPELIAAYGTMVAEELRAVGVNMNLAPVADLETNPDNPIIQRRAFGSDPVITGDTLAHYVAGLQSGGVLATLKHFPGHGDTTSDSHVELPIVPHSRERLLSTEIVPFQRASSAAAVMVAHIWYPALEPAFERPASLSANVIDGLLRQELGYEGLVLTDALDMDAVDTRYSFAQAALMALQAGADIVSAGPGINLDMQISAMQAVIDAVHSGALPAARVRESAERVLQTKARFGLLDWQPLDPATTTSRINREAHQALIDQVFQAGFTIVYDRADLLPVPPERAVAVVFLGTRQYTRPACDAHRSGIRWVGVTFSPTAEEMAWAVDAASRVETIIVFTENAISNPQQQALVKALPPNKTAVVALASPYDWRAFPEVAALALTHSLLPPAIPAACAGLFGAVPATGILPVTLAPDLPAGTRAD